MQVFFSDPVFYRENSCAAKDTVGRHNRRSWRMNKDAVRIQDVFLIGGILVYRFIIFLNLYLGGYLINEKLYHACLADSV